MKIVFYSMFSKHYSDITTQFILSFLYNNFLKNKKDNNMYCGNITEILKLYVFIKKSKLYNILNILCTDKIIEIKNTEIYFLNLKKFNNYNYSSYITNLSFNINSKDIEKTKVSLYEIIILSILECYNKLKNKYLDRKYIHKILNDDFKIPIRTINKYLKILIEKDYINKGEQIAYFEAKNHNFFIEFYNKSNIKDYKYKDSFIYMKESEIKEKEINYLLFYLKSKNIRLSEGDEFELNYIMRAYNYNFQYHIMKEVKFLIEKDVFTIKKLKYLLQKYDETERVKLTQEELNILKALK